MSINLSFHGGVGGVTGSCHLLNAGGLNILVDCGMFQGSDETEQRNSEDFGFDPASVNFLLLTHGHLDHCGRVPLLVKRGFSGKIISTSATHDIARIVLLDTARIQEEDAALWARIRKRKGMKAPEPLYTSLDVLDAIRLFDDFVVYEKPLKLNDEITVKFRDAGHILGASFLEIDIKNEKRIIFSGDLGNRNKPVVRDPVFPESADICIIEGTYSNRTHKDIATSVDELHEAITDTFRRGGNVLIPSFAIERTQDILYFIREFHEQQRIPACRVFLDSPMAINFTDIVRRHPECFDEKTLSLFKNNRDPFSFPGLYLTKTPDESMKINSIESNAIIIAGSGMCTGGRIKHHLKHNIWREESSIIFVGYQAEGTLGRRIVDREPEVKIFNENYSVRAKIYTIGGFSAHADRAILLDWLEKCGKPEHVFIVHGEKEVLTAFDREVRERNLAEQVHIPEMNQYHSL